MNFISNKLQQYIDDHSMVESDLLKALDRETHQKVLQPRMLSGSYQGRLLALLAKMIEPKKILEVGTYTCLLYTSPSPRDRSLSRMPSSA